MLICSLRRKAMKIESLSKTYKTKGGEVKALDSLSFELPEKGMVFILGKSGSGKTTLLNMLSGLDKADEGSVIELNGIDIAKIGEKERDGYRNSCCGFVFQEYDLIPELDVKENIMLSCRLQGDKDSEEKVKTALHKVELDGYGERKITELSGGQKQRVAIARAIIKDPRIVFADEPTGALDEQTGESVFELLKGISQSRLVIAVSHDREFATMYGDRIIELSDGKIVSDSDVGYIADEQERIELKRPKLPIKAAVKIGCSNFKFHPIRLVATILLSVVAFTFLGISLASALEPYENTVYNAMVADGVTYSAIYKTNDKSTTTITQAEKHEIESVAGLSFGVTAVGDIELPDTENNSYDSVLPFGTAVMTERLAGAYGFSVEGRLPAAHGEIAVTAFSADIINRRGFNMPHTADILGKSLTVDGRGLTIVGIIDTHFDGDKYSALKSSDGHDKLLEMYEITLSTSVHNIMFVCDDADGESYDVVIVKNSRAIVPYISGKSGLILNNYAVYSADAHKVTISRLKQTTGILAAVFFVFASILTLNFLLQSFTDKFYALGILKANGCNSGGCFKIFLCEALIIAAMVFVVACIFTVTACELLNAHFGIAFFGMYYAVISLLFVATVAVAVLGCVLPIIKILRISAVDLIAKIA